MQSSWLCLTDSITVSGSQWIGIVIAIALVVLVVLMVLVWCWYRETWFHRARTYRCLRKRGQEDPRESPSTPQERPAFLRGEGNDQMDNDVRIDV